MDWLHAGEDFHQSAQLESLGSLKPFLRMYLLWHVQSPLKLPRQFVAGSSPKAVISCSPWHLPAELQH